MIVCDSGFIILSWMCGVDPGSAQDLGLSCLSDTNAVTSNIYFEKLVTGLMHWIRCCLDGSSCFSVSSITGE